MAEIRDWDYMTTSTWHTLTALPDDVTMKKAYDGQIVETTKKIGDRAHNGIAYVDVLFY